jgi:hypothetical protein
MREFGLEIDWHSSIHAIPKWKQSSGLLCCWAASRMLAQIPISFVGIGVTHGLALISAAESFPTKFRYSGEGISISLAQRHHDPDALAQNGQDEGRGEQRRQPDSDVRGHSSLAEVSERPGEKDGTNFWGMIGHSLLAGFIGQDVFRRWYFVPVLYTVYCMAAMLALYFMPETRDASLMDLDQSEARLPTTPSPQTVQPH